MEIVENMASSIDNGQYTAVVFIDLKKAFDTIDHTILIAKLKHYGIRGDIYYLRDDPNAVLKC